MMKIKKALKKQLEKSFKSAQEKYADGIEAGNIKVEQQTERSVYSVILWIVLAAFVVLICEAYLFDKLAYISNSCDLILGVSPLYWVFIGMPIFFILTSLFMLFVFWRNYKELLKTGFSLDRQSSIFVKVLKKQNLKVAKIKVLFTTTIFICLMVSMVHSVNSFIVDKTNKTVASYQLIKDKSTLIQHQCLSKRKDSV